MGAPQQVGALTPAVAGPFEPAATGRVDEVLDQVGLTAAADRRAGASSLGMSQWLGIAGALLGDQGACCSTNGQRAGPGGHRGGSASFMRRPAGEGRSVLVSSHLLPEMAPTATDLVVIGRRRPIAQSSASVTTPATAIA
jgi:ABC-2 type transport system ATP-binding protein